MGGIENVDSIILIYDLDRDETFFRLENHWLPLIERCYNGEVSFSSRNPNDLPSPLHRGAHYVIDFITTGLHQ